MTVPDVMGPTSVAAELGVSRQRLHVLRQREGFPEGADVEGRTVWDGPTIRAYAADRMAAKTGREIRGMRCLHEYRRTGSINAAAKYAHMTWETARRRLAEYGALPPQPEVD